jgi:hypothetical protein
VGYVRKCKVELFQECQKHARKGYIPNKGDRVRESAAGEKDKREVRGGDGQGKGKEYCKG